MFVNRGIYHKGWTAVTRHSAPWVMGTELTPISDDEPVAEGRVEATVPMLFSGDETTDVGTDSATPVSDDHGPKETEFSGRVRWVQLDLDEAAEDLDHLIAPEERLRIAMARQ